jgi:hypothetical protein
MSHKKFLGGIGFFPLVKQSLGIVKQARYELILTFDHIGY